jgi:hypothetical protein
VTSNAGPGFIRHASRAVSGTYSNIKGISDLFAIGGDRPPQFARKIAMRQNVVAESVDLLRARDFS